MHLKDNNSVTIPNLFLDSKDDISIWHLKSGVLKNWSWASPLILMLSWKMDMFHSLLISRQFTNQHLSHSEIKRVQHSLYVQKNPHSFCLNQNEDGGQKRGNRQKGFRHFYKTLSMKVTINNTVIHMISYSTCIFSMRQVLASILFVMVYFHKRNCINHCG